MKMSLLTSETDRTILRGNRNNRERDFCFGERIRVEDYLGLISFGIFLIIVGIVFIASPSIVSDFSSWVKQMTSQKGYVRPPDGLIIGAMIFFGLIGLSDFFKSGIRLWMGKSRRKALGNAFSGAAWVLFAYLVYLYSEQMLRAQTVLAIEIVAVGFLVILYSIIRTLLK